MMDKLEGYIYLGIAMLFAGALWGLLCVLSAVLG